MNIELEYYAVQEKCSGIIGIDKKQEPSEILDLELSLSLYLLLGGEPKGFKSQNGGDHEAKDDHIECELDGASQESSRVDLACGLVLQESQASENEQESAVYRCNEHDPDVESLKDNEFPHLLLRHHSFHQKDQHWLQLQHEMVSNQRASDLVEFVENHIELEYLVRVFKIFKDEAQCLEEENYYVGQDCQFG